MPKPVSQKIRQMDEDIRRFNGEKSHLERTTPQANRDAGYREEMRALQDRIDGLVREKDQLTKDEASN